MVEAKRLMEEEEGPVVLRRGTSFAMRKVVIVGDTGVGKTSILSRFINGWMPGGGRRSTVTMGATEKLKSIHFAGTNKKLPLQIWDIPGAEKFRTLSSIYFRDADAAILVYDCTNKESFTNLKQNWLRELQAIAPETMLKFIVGNKSDLVEELEESKDRSECVTDKMLREFAMNKKAESMKVSARKNQGIDEVF